MTERTEPCTRLHQKTSRRPRRPRSQERRVARRRLRAHLPGRPTHSGYARSRRTHDMPLSDRPNSNSSPEASRNLSLWPERALRGRSGVILDDQSLLDGNGERDLVAFGQAGERALHLVLVPVQVHGGLGRDLERFTDRDEVAALLADLDRLTRLHVRTGNVDPPSVHEHVAVGHELASLALGQRESQAKDDDVQPRLQLPDELLAGHAGPPGGPVVIDPHLALPDTVDRTELLLLQEPALVLGQALLAPAA